MLVRFGKIDPATVSAMPYWELMLWAEFVPLMAGMGWSLAVIRAMSEDERHYWLALHRTYEDAQTIRHRHDAAVRDA